MDIRPVELDQQHELSRLINGFIYTDGAHATAIPSLRIMRSTKPSQQLLHSIYTFSLCVVLQGTKLAMLGKESFEYSPAAYLVTAVNLPITSRVIEASPESPYLSVQLSFNPNDIFYIIKESNLALNKKSDTELGLFINKTTPLILDPLIRLIRLLDTPDDIPFLAPMLIREILYRVLQDDKGNLISQFYSPDSHAYKIAEAIRLINRDFSKTLRIEDLANVINLSPSAFHKYFKKVTNMSPLHYQKVVRLQNARQLLISESLDASEVAYLVGYESPSQFSREYARMFGLPPIKDVKSKRNSIV
ncbi:MAG: AraC family transcriptional regulator [Bacillota bacterium]|nr:AraC family transcriptional regulator [Bacillota bacterium]